MPRRAVEVTRHARAKVGGSAPTVLLMPRALIDCSHFFTSTSRYWPPSKAINVGTQPCGRSSRPRSPGRTILGEDIVLFRASDKAVVALEDRCPLIRAGIQSAMMAVVAVVEILDSQRRKRVGRRL